MEGSALISEQANAVLGLIADLYNNSPDLNKQLKGQQGWINLSVGLETGDGSISKGIIFKNGEVSALEHLPDKPDCSVIFAQPENFIAFLEATPEESYKMIMRGGVRFEGNMMSLGLWDYLISLAFADNYLEAVSKQVTEHREASRQLAESSSPFRREEQLKPFGNLLRGDNNDPAVLYLDDPYLSRYKLHDFPRLQELRSERMAACCEISSELGKLLTDFHVQYGYETDPGGKRWDPLLRKAASVKYLLKNRKPIIRNRDLLGGTWTDNPILGGLARPYAEASYIWGELNTCSQREYAPYKISSESRDLFHHYIFPYWRERNILELWKKECDNKIGPRIHEQFFAITFWATVSESENNPGFEKVLNHGTQGLMQIIDKELLMDKKADQEKRNTLLGMNLCLEGVNAYAANLAKEAENLAAAEENPSRQEELLHISQTLEEVPQNPAKTLEEAIQSILITLICLGWETMDASISLGRLDQLLQPYFTADISKLETPAEKEAYIEKAIELVGLLFLQVAGREIIAMDLAQLQNSGSAPNTCVTFGGITRDGRDAVNDMTYIILKVTEMLALNHPNTHARYKPGLNSMAYLKRVAEVNYLTGATPALHNDDAVIKALSEHEGWKIEDIRDWASTGCVEPSIPGLHAGTTSSLEINLVAPLEMAMHNGRHPVANWKLGPPTGAIEDYAFPEFEDFFAAFSKQCAFIFEQSVRGNNELGEIFHRHHPHLLISALTENCIESGREFLRGGARYNSSGATLIGLSDVVDSLTAIKKLVYDDRLITFPELKEAVDNNFALYPELHALIKSRVARFGSGNPASLAMARRVMKLVHEFFASSRDYKGGVYTTGWWSMAHHVVYGRVTNALPSGRLAGEPFTPGLTPHPSASSSLLDNLRDVASLEPETMDNNIAFNVKLVPGQQDSHKDIITNIANYMKTFCELGGMQLQFNVVSSDTLKDAMANPEHYQDLIVRISGYLAYFTRIHYELQLELVRRAEYRL